MAFGFAQLPAVTINSGTTDSNTIVGFEDAYALSIQAPATLTSTAVTVAVIGSTSTTASFSTLQSGGVDIVLTQGKACIITPIPYRQLKLQGTAAEGSDRSFTVAKVFLT